MAIEKKKTYLVTGFMDAGKTTYIQDFIFRDYFHKREHGKTLILVFDFGDEDYDTEKLLSYRTEVEAWEGGDIATFLFDAVKKHDPDRIFVECNCMTDGLTDVLKECVNIVSTTMLINAETLEMYYLNMLQFLQDMVREADPVIFNRAKEKEELQPYAATFRLMNQKAGFLWESPMGYHEKVFGNALPFDRMQQHICLTETDYPHWYLDALEYPDPYAGKELEMDVQIIYDVNDQKNPDAYTQSPVTEDSPANNKTDGPSNVTVGRTVMTCCMNDIQFLGFPLKSDQPLPKNKSFVHLTVKAGTTLDPLYKTHRLYLQLLRWQPIPYPSQLILSVKKAALDNSSS